MATLAPAVSHLLQLLYFMAPADPWVPWDQVDFVLGALALVWGQAALSWADLATILLLSMAGHVLVNHLGYWLGIRDVRW